MLVSILNNKINLIYSPKIKVFKEDNFFVDDEEYTILSEGYYLTNTPSITEPTKLDYKEFVEKHKGRFVYCYLNKKDNTLKIYNDKLSKKFIYVYNLNSNIVFSTSFIEIVDFLKNNGLEFTINESSFEYFIKNRFFEDDKTYINEIKLLKPYNYIEYDSELKMKTLEYPKPIKNISLEVATEKTYELFEIACKLQFQKAERNTNYHLISISAGMDSRAVLLQLLNYTDPDKIYTYTYAENSSLDHNVAKQICGDKNLKNTFISLDGGEFILNRDEFLDKNEGQMYYCGATGMLESMKVVDKPKNTLIHLGIGGGEIFGDILKKEYEVKSGDYDKKSYQINLNDIRCCQNSLLIASDKYEVASPFLFEDFYEYVMSLPYEIKENRKLYVSLFDKYMKNDYLTTSFRGKIGDKEAFIAKAIRYIKKKILKKDKYSMNPFEYWIYKNPKLLEYINTTYNSDVEKIRKLNYNINIPDINSYNIIYDKLAVLTISGMLRRILK